MIELDLAAIRARDAEWTDKRPMRESSGRDRRALLQYIDELESLMVEIAADVKVIKRVHREHYLPRPAPEAPSETLDLSDNASKGLRNFRAGQATGKLDP